MIDFDNISRGSGVFTVPLNLKGGLQAADNLREVTVNIRDQGLNSKFIEIPLTADKVRFLNNPTNQSPVFIYKNGEIQQSLSVSIQGAAASVEAVTVDNLSITVDLKNTVVTDGSVYQARVAIAGYDDLWVYYGSGDLHGIEVTLNAG